MLGVKKNDRAVIPLIRTIEKNLDDPYILESAVTALGRIGDCRATGIIAALLRNSYLIVRVSAAKALGLIKDPLAIE